MFTLTDLRVLVDKPYGLQRLTGCVFHEKIFMPNGTKQCRPHHRLSSLLQCPTVTTHVGNRHRSILPRISLLRIIDYIFSTIGTSTLVLRATLEPLNIISKFCVSITP